MGTSSKRKKTKYTKNVLKLRFRVMCNMCDRMKRRFVQVGKVKENPIIICVNCVDKVRNRQ